MGNIGSIGLTKNTDLPLAILMSVNAACKVNGDSLELSKVCFADLEGDPGLLYEAVRREFLRNTMVAVQAVRIG